MQNNIFRRLSVLRCRSSLVPFSLAWLTGLLFGIFFVPYAGEAYISLMRSAAGCAVSIVGLFAMVLVPFLLAALAVFYNLPALIYLLGFTKAFSHALCAGGIAAAFGSAGWLIRFLLLFSDCCTLPLLCWFMMRCLDSGKQYLRKDLSACLIISVAVCGFDYLIVSPLLVTLI